MTVSLYFPTGSSSYTLSVESMRAPSECANLPESFFSLASDGRTGTLPAGLAAYCYKFNQPTGTVLHLAAVCFSIPADQHAARETFTWRRTSGTGDARMSVFSEEGYRYCGPTGYYVERTIICWRLVGGRPVTLAGRQRITPTLPVSGRRNS